MESEWQEVSNGDRAPSEDARERAREMVAYLTLPDPRDATEADEWERRLETHIARMLDAYATERVRAERQALTEQMWGALSIAKREVKQEPSEMWQGFIQACEAIVEHIEERNEATK